MINPPIVLYYIQGINTTPIHAHTALFGVYGLSKPKARAKPRKRVAKKR
jgi:nitric oxide reductase large subunit